MKRTYGNRVREASHLQYLIVGTQRTGSSALGEGLGIHPRIACGWEWTQHEYPWRKLILADRALSGDFTVLSLHHREHMAQSFNPEKSVIGFRRLFRSSDKWILHPRCAPALWVDRLEAHLRWIRTRPHVHVVHIVRRNNLGWLRSKALSAATGQYFGVGYPEDSLAVIPVARALRRLKSKAWVDRRLASLKKTNPYMRVEYEEFLQDNAGKVHEVVKFLGCDITEMPQLEMRAKPQSRAADVRQIQDLDTLESALRRHDLLWARD